MKIGIIGSGVVGQTLGAKLVALGHDVVLGTRDPKKLGEKKNMAGSLEEWLGTVKQKARVASFKEAAAHGDLLICATHGQVTIEALQMAEAGKVGPKVLIEVGNEIDMSKGFPPAVFASQDRCLAERVQAAFPNLKVVKSLNTVAATVMVNPKGLKGGDHTLFVSGNDKDAKAKVTELLKSFGWSDIIDLGDVSSARAPEMYMAMWTRLYGALQNGNINIKVQR
ncbi:MAG TPA: NAD(P)-binding domain-containing protein [Myxococcales bacterium]|nr:NAD(P)-binding domain-containing protein [Myxococcales bacterium]